MFHTASMAWQVASLLLVYALMSDIIFSKLQRNESDSLTVNETLTDRQTDTHIYYTPYTYTGLLAEIQIQAGKAFSAYRNARLHRLNKIMIVFLEHISM